MEIFWKWKNSAEGPGGDSGGRTLIIDGEIAEYSWFEDALTPEIFRAELNDGTGDITVWLNSPGGDCVAAAQIYNMLRDYKGNVTVKIDGMAASAASVIAMAGDKVLMSPASIIMIHNPSAAAYGYQADMERAAEMLKAFKESIINAYEIKTKLPRLKLSRLMDAEKYMDANEAIELGFADGMIEAGEKNKNYTFADICTVRTAACRNLYSKISAKYEKKAEKKPPWRKPEIELFKEHRADEILNRLLSIRKHI